MGASSGHAQAHVGCSSGTMQGGVKHCRAALHASVLPHRQAISCHLTLHMGELPIDGPDLGVTCTARADLGTAGQVQPQSKAGMPARNFANGLQGKQLLWQA